MNELLKPTDGHKEPSGLERLLSWVFQILTFYVFPYVVTGCVVVISLLYLIVWLSAGFLVVAYITLGFYLFMVGGSIVIWYLINHPGLSWFVKYPSLYSLVQVLDFLFKWLRLFHARLLAEAKRLIVLKKQLVVWSAKKFGELSVSKQIVITALAVLLFVPLMIWMFTTTVDTVKDKWPYGVSRSEMTPEELATRKRNRIDAALWAVWGKPNAVANAKCMNQYKKLIDDEALKNGLTPERLEAQLFVESSCNTDQINPNSGAAGFAQIMLSVGCEENLVMDTKFCRSVLASGGKIKFLPKNEKIVDRRLDPKFAIPVAAKIIGKATKYWGDEHWAFVQYHMGIGNQRKLVMFYLDETRPGWRKNFPANFDQTKDPDGVIPTAIRNFGITYDDIFFRCTPKFTPKTYSHLRRLSDDSATYVYTGLAAMKGFALMRSDYTAFEQMVRNQQDPDGGFTNRPMRSWFSDDEARYHYSSDVEKAIDRGELVPVPNNPTNGFVLRTEGSSKIGECDPGNEQKYYFTKKATLGMILFIAARMKELQADRFEVTGLVRTNWMYDDKRCLPNTSPRTHVIGSAFDIGANINGQPMSEKTKRSLMFVLRDLKTDGIIDHIPEGTAFHIVYNPDFEDFFIGIYDAYVNGESLVDMP